MPMKNATKALIFAIVVGLSTASCAPGLDGAKQAVLNATNVQTQAMQLLVQYDQTRQREIIERAKRDHDVERATAEVDLWRKQRAVAEKVVIDTAALTTAAATAIPLVEDGLKPRAELDKLLQEIFASMMKLRESMSSLGIGGL